MKELIRTFDSCKNKLISFEEVSKYPVGKKVKVSDGIEVERLDNHSGGSVFFKIGMDKGSLIANTIHDSVEDMVLLEGKILEVMSGEEISDNIIFRFAQKQPHSLYALEESVLYVQIHEPNTIITR